MNVSKDITMLCRHMHCNWSALNTVPSCSSSGCFPIACWPNHSAACSGSGRSSSSGFCCLCCLRLQHINSSSFISKSSMCFMGVTLFHIFSKNAKQCYHIMFCIPSYCSPFFPRSSSPMSRPWRRWSPKPPRIALRRRGAPGGRVFGDGDGRSMRVKSSAPWRWATRPFNSWLPRIFGEKHERMNAKVREM